MATSTDTLIVGAGPIGLEVAAALKRAGREYVQVDAGQIGDTISWWAPGTRFFSSPERIGIAGVPLALPHQDKATREEYLAYLRAVVRQFGLPVRTFERVEAIEPGTGRRFRVRTRTLRGVGHIDADAVVLAIGDMHAPRLLNVPGEDLPHVDHYLRDPHAYFGRRVLIIGGRNSAVEAAIRLHRVGADVTLSYRQDRFDAERIKYWLLPELEWLIKKDAIRFHPRTVPVRISPEAVTLRRTDSGAEFDAPADAVLALTGYVQDTGLFESCGVQLTGETRGPRHNPRTMETNVPGLFVAGTATAGTQNRFRVFIENSHAHADRILASLSGAAQAPLPAPVTPDSLLES